MRRAVAAIVLVVALPPVADAFREDREPAKWSLVQVSPSGRYLQIAALGGGCTAGLVARATESADSVVIHVEHRVFTPTEPNEACTADVRFESVGVVLNAPIAGRRVVGQWRTTALIAGDLTAPRMVGLRAGDAARALANHGRRWRLVGSIDNVVTRQKPAPGKPAPNGVTLVAR